MICFISIIIRIISQPLTAAMKMMTVEMKISVKLKLWHQIKGSRDLFLHIPMKTIFSVY